MMYVHVSNVRFLNCRIIVFGVKYGDEMNVLMRI